MNDLSVASRFTPVASDSYPPQSSTALAGLCDASARAAELMSSAPNLHQAARTLVGAALLRVGIDYSPDFLFLNSRSSEGALLSSVSLTKGMIQTLIDGMDVFDSDLIAVYTRHDSVDDAYLARPTDDAALKEVFTYASERLSDHYIDLLDEFWSHSMKLNGTEGEFVTRQRAWASLQHVAFATAIEIGHLSGSLDAQDRARLEESLSQPMPEGVHRVSLITSGQAPALLSSSFVIALEPWVNGMLSLESSKGAVCLLSARYGAEKFSSLELLEDKLRDRLADSTQRRFLTDDLLLNQAHLLDQASLVGIQYTPVSDYLVRDMARMLRSRQVEDFHYLVSRAPGTNVSSLAKAVNESTTLVYLDEARRQNFNCHMQRLQALNMPSWLKHASGDEQVSYELFDSEYRRRAAATSQLLAGLESVEEYALLKVDDYIRGHLGYRIDPRKVFITLEDKWPSPTSGLHATYRKSLFEYALDGLPSVDAAGARVDLPEHGNHPAFTFEFIKELIAHLDLRHHYRQELEARYRRPDTQRALLHQRDSALALSLWAQRLQHHISDESVELVMALRTDQPRQGATRTTGGLEVGGKGNQLRDVIVFSEHTTTDQRHVLYAPGAPGGRDMFEFGSWRQLYHEVAGWSATPNGREYLISQSAPASRVAMAAFMNSVSQKPTVWKEQDVREVAVPESNFEDSLLMLINTKLGYQLAELPPVIGGGRNAAGYERRQQLALFDARVEFLKKSYEKSMQLISYAHFARLAGETYISNVLKRKGVELTINPDTVYFDLNERARKPTPDFGPNTDLVTLTQLLMNDFIYDLDERAPVYSSIGQDISQLSVEVIREVLAAHLGEKYIEILKEEYSDRKHPDHTMRMALFAQRTFFEVQRDIAITSLEKGFTEEQYVWANDLLATVYPDRPDNSSSAVQGVESSSINQLYLNGRLIEGVLVFKNTDTDAADFNLVYTPNAPDGIRFRNYGIFVSTLNSPGMGAYYYNRVSYKNQPAIGSFFSELERNRQQAMQSMTIDANDRVRDLQVLHEAMIKRMMQDVDAQSLSGAEGFASSLYTLVKWTGTILLLPFPPAALAWGLLNTSIDLARGYLAYLDGDRAAASPYYFWGVLGLVLGALGANDLAQSTSGRGLQALRWALRKSHPDLAQ